MLPLLVLYHKLNDNLHVVSRFDCYRIIKCIEQNNN